MYPLKVINSLIVDIWYQFYTGIFIPTKIFDSLKENVYHAIRQGATIQFSRHALQHRNFDDTLRTTIDNFAQETIDALEAGNFFTIKVYRPSRQSTIHPCTHVFLATAAHPTRQIHHAANFAIRRYIRTCEHYRRRFSTTFVEILRFCGNWL